MTLGEVSERAFWTLLTPVFPFIQHSLLKLHIIHHKGRQPYLLGYLRPDRTLHGLKKYLSREWGFGNHFIAWEDSNQVLGWRKRLDFTKQYHLRVFRDGEIRGHFEYTPESHPARHFFDKGMEPRTEDFLKFLGDWVVAEKPRQ
jgi:hypothetical protein